VKINTIIPDSYPWYAKYFTTKLTLQAIPTNTDYVFHHWELSNINIGAGQSLNSDSVTANLNTSTNIVAVFTDKRNGITNGGDVINIPTGFTPNGDGLNDNFRPLGSAEFTTEYQMTIWNRWGQEVFRSVEVPSGWDGKYKGQDAQTGVYAYLITYRDIYNKEQVVRGNVTLTR
jgi:gliding motility-associated-like protein